MRFIVVGALLSSARRASARASAGCKARRPASANCRARRTRRSRRRCGTAHPWAMVRMAPRRTLASRRPRGRAPVRLAGPACSSSHGSRFATSAHACGRTGQKAGGARPSGAGRIPLRTPRLVGTGSGNPWAVVPTRLAGVITPMTREATQPTAATTSSTHLFSSSPTASSCACQGAQNALASSTTRTTSAASCGQERRGSATGPCPAALASPACAMDGRPNTCSPWTEATIALAEARTRQTTLRATTTCTMG
mmetsp:Transcript_110175/g.344743  ORF Transcript_110175/g.344743 Transcript_110175/m.344743 type:complete len:253 (+) Transcript_110175:76-834(+)